MAMPYFCPNDNDNQATPTYTQKSMRTLFRERLNWGPIFSAVVFRRGELANYYNIQIGEKLALDKMKAC